MGGKSMKSNPVKGRKRVEAESEVAETSSATSSLIRGKNGSAFARCEKCNKDVPAAVISMHSCTLDAKIKLNLESQVVEVQSEAKKKPVEKRAAEPKEPKARRQKKSKSEENKNKPKRPPTAFFIFLEDFRKEFKLANPESKDVKRIAKEGGEKWKAMSDEEKKTYIEKASELKAEYKKALEDDIQKEDEAAADDADEED